MCRLDWFLCVGWPSDMLYFVYSSKLYIEIWSKIYWMTFIHLIVEDSHSNGNELIFETFFLYKYYKICNWTINQVFSSKYLNYSNNVVRTFFSFQKSSRMLPNRFYNLLLHILYWWVSSTPFGIPSHLPVQF